MQLRRTQCQVAIITTSSLSGRELAAEHLLGRITLDDGRNAQNANPAIHPAGGDFDLDHRFRGGAVWLSGRGICYRAGQAAPGPTDR